MYAVQPENNLVGVDSQATFTSVVDNLYHTRVSFRKVPIEVLPPSTHQSPTNSKPTVVVAVVGGFILIVALVLTIVPLAQRRASESRRRKRQAEDSSSSDVTSTTVASRREPNNRTLSVDASVPP